MELWEKVILEWINCLEVQQETVKNITELQDGVFYVNFLKLIKWKKFGNCEDQEDIILKFLEDEYPTFKVNKDDITEHIYIASLLLLHLCRALFAIHNSLQYNMCDNLRNETQIRVKAFLESVLPLGKDITKETMREVIMEVEDMSTAVNTCRTPPTEDLFKSPLTCSARSKRILTDRVRELRELKCNLSIERFTNADLQDDIRRQHNKIKKLQKKLDEKAAKIKELQEERMKPGTPRPSHAKEDKSQDDYYKRYINDLENQLSKQEGEINKLETDKDALSKELCCMRRTSVHYEENFTSCERSLESLSNKMELKDRELIELRMHNEELRAHMRELNRNTNPEQSFEVEELSFPAARSLNTSEVMSSVIEIQLQEAKEESAILYAQVDTLKGRLDIHTKDYRAAMESNRDLQAKLKTLDRVQAELNNMQKELDVSNTTITNLQVEKVSLVTQTEDLKNLLSSKEKDLSEIEEENKQNLTELANIEEDNKQKDLLLNEREEAIHKYSQEIEILKEIKDEKLVLERNVYELTNDLINRELLLKNVMTQLENVQDINKDFNLIKEETQKNFGEYKKNIGLTFEKLQCSYYSELNNIQKELDMSNTTITNLQAEKVSLVTQTEDLKSSLSSKEKELSEIEEQNKQNLSELANIEEDNKQKDLLLNEREETIHKYSQEIEILKEIKDEKLVLERNVYELTNDLMNRELLLKNVMTQLENVQDINKDFNLIKEETQKNFGEYKKNIGLTFEKLQCSYHTELNNMQKELDMSNTTITNLQAEKVSLVTQTEDLKSSLSSKEKKLSEIEEQNKQNLTELANIEEDNKQKDLLLNEREETIHKYSQEIEILKEIKDEKLVLERNVYELTNDLMNRELLLKNVMTQLENVQDINKDFNLIKEETQKNFGEYKKNIGLTFEKLQCSYYTELNNMQKELDMSNTTITNLQAEKVSLVTQTEDLKSSLSSKEKEFSEIEEQNKQNHTELANIEEDNKQKDLLLNEREETIHKYSQEIEILKEIKDEKLVLERNVYELTNDLMNRELLLKNVMTQLENVQDINKDLNLIKEETRKNFGEYHKNIKVTFEKLQCSYYTLHHNFHKVQQENEKLEYNFNCSKEELLKIQAINTTLQQNLLEKKEKIGALEEKKRILFDKLNESQRNVQELKDINRALEEQYATMKTEADDNLESLKSDNAKILLELKSATDKLDLLHQEVTDTMTQMELKEDEINDLLLDISVLETKKNDLIHSHKKTLETKDKEIEMKEETLLTLQTKMDKLTSEANTAEKKMKEIIINLQEVRSSQDAVLTTQGAALKEKCLHIEELQERFDNSKEILNKELEDAKSSLRECQIKFFDLENQLNKQNRNIAELQDILKTMSAELETSKEYCKHMDVNQAEIVKLCQELEHPTKNLNSTIMETCSDLEFLDQNSHDVPQYECINIGNKYERINRDNNANILNVIKMTLDELYKSQKVISHLSSANAELNETLTTQKILVENGVKDKEEVCSLKNKVREMEIIAQKRNSYLKSLIKNKESLKDSLQKVLSSRNDLDVILTSSKQKWNEILTKFQDIFYTENSVCDEFKQLQIKKGSLENMLLKYQMDYSENIKSISDILWEKFLWTEQKLLDTYLCSIHERECLDLLTSVEEDQFSNEKMIIDMDLNKYKALQTDVMKSEEEIESFIALATFYDNGLKSGEIKTRVDIEKKLQSQINQLTKEKKDLKTKMDTMRLRNVRLEKNIDDLRTEIKKLKSTETASVEANSTAPMEASLTASTEANLTEMQSLKEELKHLKEQNQQLREEKDESSKMAKQESQLKEMHVIYEQKLEDIKQKMKTAYNEQMMKLNKDQEKIVREKLQSQMETMCQRQREELNRYKAHVGELSSQLWSVGEKLLIEQQQKQDILQRLKELETKVKEVQADQPIATISRKSYRMEKQEILPENVQQAHKVTTFITEETLERRHSIRSIQAMGNAFKTEDEEEIFDNVYLADMKRGSFVSTTDFNRLSVLQMRNSLCKPHLKSSYPAEMQFLPSTLTEEEIKGASSEDTFNDSLSQSLLPEQKARKKDRSQISYKKPGPPTPSKNGGRLSLQGNELKSPSTRVLRERNVDRRTTTTPHSLKNMFSLKRQDENATSTPKGRRLSNLFRKSRLQSDR